MLAGGTVQELQAVNGPGFGLETCLVGRRYERSLWATVCASLVIFALGGCSVGEPTALERHVQTSGPATTFDTLVAKAKRKAIFVESVKIEPATDPKARRAGLPSCALTKAESNSDGKAGQKFVSFMKQANKPPALNAIALNPGPKGLRFLKSVACDVQFPNGPTPSPTAVAKIPVSDTDRAVIAAMDKKFCVVLVPCQPRPSPNSGQPLNSADASDAIDTNLTAVASEQNLRKRLENCDLKLLQQCPV